MRSLSAPNAASTTRARPTRFTWFACAVVLSGLVLSAYGISVWRSVSRLAPPAEAQSLREFREFLPSPRAITIVAHNRKKYIVIFGDQAIALFNERPAGYLFDHSGNLIAWSSEASDVDRWSEFWELANAEIRANRELTYEEALRAIDTSGIPGA